MSNPDGFFKPGNKYSPGRQKGSQNRITGKARKMFAMLLEENIEQLRDDLRAMSPEKRAEILLKMAQFCVPKLQAVHITSWTEVHELLEMDEQERMDEILRLEEIIKEGNNGS